MTVFATKTPVHAPMKSAAHDYVVADITLADWGRKEIAIAEHEMPGLMAIRRKYAAEPAAQGRPHRRQPAHDHPDGGADRDAASPRRRHPLGELQHLLDAGPRRRRHRRQGHARLRQEGRNAGRILGIHPSHSAMGRRRHAQPHPRRRRRRHAAAPPRLRCREGRQDPRRARPSREEEAGPVRRRSAPRSPTIRTSTAGSPRTSSASRRKPPPASSGSTSASRRARCCSRPSTSTTASPRASSTTSTAAAKA